MQFKTFNLTIRVLKVILLIITIVGIWYLYRDWLARRRAKTELPKHRNKLIAALSEIDEIFANKLYFSNYQEQIFRGEYQYVRKLIPAKHEQLGLSDDLTVDISRFVTVFDNLNFKRIAYNDEFVKSEVAKYSNLFGSLEAYPLSPQQIEAIVRDEDNTLVLAGAGTGKTTTIAGKVAYLLEKGLARPEDLLIISFTKNAVEEMRERCMRFCKNIPNAQNLEIRTFNGFGYFVKRSCSTEELHLAFKGDDKLAKQFLQDAFDRFFIENYDFQRKAINFISFFNRPERDEFDFDTVNDFIQYEKSFKNITLDGIEVKSKEELQIANFFCVNGINYEYEKHYPLAPEDRSVEHASYYPDFYLPDHEVWHEHYGIDREGNVPKRFGSKPGFATGKDYYHALINWKENIHTKYGTKLIKTYSYENSEGRLLSNLKGQLAELNIELKPRDAQEILNMVRKSPHYEDFLDLIYTFLGLMKSNGKTPDTIQQKRKDKRFKVFMSVFEPLFQAYEERLKKKSEIDFNDMINRAAEHIHSGHFGKAYKYVLIDEFQDMSLGRYALLKSIRKQNPGVKLYAVGDDWQSIFRFTGSDVSIITSFEEHFGYTSQIAILNTYRFNEEILNVSSNFIQKNPAQLKKTLKSIRLADAPSFVFIPLQNTSQIAKTEQIDSILKGVTDLQNTATIYLIGRYHHNQPVNLQALQTKYSNLNIEYHTAHKVKGMTCDYAILLDINSGTVGFPSEMADDPILDHLLQEGDTFDNAEERRLFYVAITRAKHRNFLLFDATNPSKFISELHPNFGIQKSSQIICPDCQGIMVKRIGPYSEFYGCTNYPQCEGKLSVLEARL